MLKKSIIGKLWISIVVLIIIVLFFLSFGLSRLLENFYYSQISNDLVLEGKQLVDVLSQEQDPQTLRSKLDLLSRFTNAHIVIVDEKGLVEACNTMMGLPTGSLFKPEELQKVFTGQIITKRGYHHHFDAPMLSAAVPIYDDNEINRALMLFKPVAPITNTVNSQRLLIFYTAIGAIILASIVSYFLSRTLSRPLVQMNKIATEMAKGNFENKIVVNSEDEVGLLGASLNYMSTQLKNNITELSHEKAKLENILASMSDGVITLNPEGKIILINPPAEKMLEKYCQDISSGQQFFECIGIEEFEFLFDKVNEEKKIKQQDIELNDKILFVRMAPLLDTDTNSVIGVVGILQDVTKERELEQMRRDFIANVSHELRTPLSLMQGYSEALLDGMAQDISKREKIITIIHQETLRLKRMVNELLDLSRLQTGHFALNKQELSVSDMLQMIEEKYKPAINDAGLDFVVNIEEELPKLTADHDRLQQVLINLLENALKHTEQGKITVSGYREKDQVCVQVTDTGSGIPKEDIDLIWERFHKADKSRSRAKGGTGLGLAIVKSIIEAHGGRVWVKSEEGVGSAFGFCLPI